MPRAMLSRFPRLPTRKTLRFVPTVLFLHIIILFILKISATTTDILVEVTGDSIPTLREVMNELIGSLFKVSVELDADEADDPNLVEANNSLVKKIKGEEGPGTVLLEPVVVETAEGGQLLVKYPARIDLQLDGVDVMFE